MDGPIDGHEATGPLTSCKVSLCWSPTRTQHAEQRSTSDLATQRLSTLLLYLSAVVGSINLIHDLSRGVCVYGETCAWECVRAGVARECEPREGWARGFV
jgi:hypothetical protein